MALQNMKQQRKNDENEKTKHRNKHNFLPAPARFAFHLKRKRYPAVPD
jgi:hypothetical protein